MPSVSHVGIMLGHENAGTQLIMLLPVKVRLQHMEGGLVGAIAGRPGSRLAWGMKMQEPNLIVSLPVRSGWYYTGSNPNQAGQQPYERPGW